MSVPPTLSTYPNNWIHYYCNNSDNHKMLKICISSLVCWSFNLESVSHRHGNTSSPLTITAEITLKTMVSYFIGPHLNFQFRRFFSAIVRKGLNLNWTRRSGSSPMQLLRLFQTEINALGSWMFFAPMCMEIFLPVVNSNFIVLSLFPLM